MGFYRTYKEAQKATQSLGIKDSIEYRCRYQEDLLLPSSPDEKYASDWDGWPEFLGKSSKYETLEEASKAAQVLGFKNRLDYDNNYHKDPKLPASPQTYYKDEWDGWGEFLGKSKSKYKTIEEASNAACRLKIKDSKSYRQEYKKDARLPSNPDRTYNEHWTSWESFLNK